MKYLSIILALSVVNLAYASLLRFYPLTAKQVYTVLRRVDREDAIPEGRFITQGLAAMTGYTAGYITGIGVPLILNIDLANVTGILGSPRNNTASNELKMQEICFNSRSLNEIEDNDYDDNDYDDENENEEAAENEQNEKSFDRNMKFERFKLSQGRELVENSNENTFADPTTTETSSTEPTYDDSSISTPTTEAENAENQDDFTNIDESPSDTGTAADISAGTGTNLVRVRTPQVDTRSTRTINCIVIQ